MTTTSEKTNNNTKTLYLIDGHAQIFRAYHAIRSLSSPITQEPTNATFGFVGMLIKLFRDCQPDYVIVTLDRSGDRGTFRSQLYPDYKANRKAPPEDLAPQVQRIIEICEQWHIPTLGVEQFEADDLIATLCREFVEQHDNLNIRIVSRDKDLQQLLNHRVAMYDIHKNELINTERLLTDKGIRPDQVIDMLALMGDSADNIPGVKGIGPKTAANLLAEHGSIDGILAHQESLPKRVQTNLQLPDLDLQLNRDLVTLRYDVPHQLTLEGATVGITPVDQLRPLFKKLGFNKHLTDLNALPQNPTSAAITTDPIDEKKQTDADERAGTLFGLADDTSQASPPTSPQRALDTTYQMITTEAQLDQTIRDIQTAVQAGKALAIDTETDRLNPIQAQLCGISLSWAPSQGVYIPVRSKQPEGHLTPEIVLTALAPILSDPTIMKIGQNIKYDLIILRQAGATVAGPFFDTMVAAYVLDATRTSFKLDHLALAYLNYEMIPITQLIGEKKNQRSMIDLTAEEVADYAAEDADITRRLYELLSADLKEQQLDELFNDLESPIVDILARMEQNGICVNDHELAKQQTVIDQRIIELHEEILTAANTPSPFATESDDAPDPSPITFNPNSPKQLADVLFNQLGCQVVKKNKNGPSTDNQVLQQIATEQLPPGATVAEHVLVYRQLTKLSSTYLKSLREAIDPTTHRIHASFNQTVAATGRLSSSNPNLQNIPIKTDIGKQIRRAFVAPKDHVLLAADYSQIELRLLAHLANDPKLREAFQNNIDIHQAVAAEIFDVPLDQVTDLQRRSAKMVNFGIIYGITPYGLARRLPDDVAGAKVHIAKQIIEDYNQQYPMIDAFANQCVQQAQERGYVETICHRRRTIPQLQSNRAQLLALGRRLAINTVVQGSAADLIKTAMINIARGIQADRRPIKLLLQIHDELIFEIPQKDVEVQAPWLRQQMIDALPLSVPMQVDLAWADNWFDAK